MKDWNEKVRQELPMDMEEMLSLDEALASTEFVRPVVASLDHDDLSLAWRSELNEKLNSVKPKKSKLGLWLPVGASAVAAATLAVLLFMTPQSESQNEAVSQTDTSVEALILRSHREAEAATVLGVASPSPVKNSTTQVFDWSKLEQS